MRGWLPCCFCSQGEEREPTKPAKSDEIIDMVSVKIQESNSDELYDSVLDGLRKKAIKKGK